MQTCRNRLARRTLGADILRNLHLTSVRNRSAVSLVLLGSQLDNVMGRQPWWIRRTAASFCSSVSLSWGIVVTNQEEVVRSLAQLTGCCCSLCFFKKLILFCNIRGYKIIDPSRRDKKLRMSFLTNAKFLPFRILHAVDNGSYFWLFPKTQFFRNLRYHFESCDVLASQLPSVTSDI